MDVRAWVSDFFDSGDTSTPVAYGTCVDIWREPDEPAEFTWHSLVVLFWVVLIALMLLPLLLAVHIITRMYTSHVVSVLALWMKLRFLFGPITGQREMVPVTILRLDDPRGYLHEVRVKGRFQHGSVTTGDTIYVWGTYRDRIVRFRRGLNMRTGASLETNVVRRQTWIYWLAIGTVCLLIFCAGLGLAIMIAESGA